MAASNPQAHASTLLLKIGDANDVRELIEEDGANVEATDQNEATALMLAVESGRLDEPNPSSVFALPSTRISSAIMISATTSELNRATS